MATEVLKTFSALQDELQKAKEGLRNVDSHIKRIIGRDPEAQPPGQGPPRPGQKRAAQNDDFYARGRGSFQMGAGRGRAGPPGRPQEEEGPPGIRRRLGERTGTVFSRLSGPPIKQIKKEKDDDYVHGWSHDGPPRNYKRDEQEEEEFEDDDAQFKPAISSRVIPQTRELPSKEVILAAQGDERSKARNRRMFGALLGTLQRFRQEETRMRDREDKRAVVEKKLEEAAKREKEEMKKERQELFLDRRKKQQEIRRIEFKIQRVKEQDQWEARHRPLLNFIQTKSKPAIFYLPKVQNTKSEERLVASQKIIAKLMEKKRAAVQEELDRLEGNAQIKTENAEEQPFEDEEEEEMNTENGPKEPVEELPETTDDSPVENKENRLRFSNVKEEDADTVQLEPEEKKRESDNHRQPSNQKRVRESRETNYDRSKDRQRRDQLNDRDDAKDKDLKRERVKEKDRGTTKERDRTRERVEDKKDDEEKWDRKRERHDSSDANAMEDEDEPADVSVPPPPELSSISLPGEQSPSFIQSELGELDDGSD